MFGLGLIELLVIVATLFLLIGIPIIAVVVALLLVSRSKATTYETTESEQSNPE